MSSGQTFLRKIPSHLHSSRKKHTLDLAEYTEITKDNFFKVIRFKTYFGFLPYEPNFW